MDSSEERFVNEAVNAGVDAVSNAVGLDQSCTCTTPAVLFIPANSWKCSKDFFVLPPITRTC